MAPSGLLSANPLLLLELFSALDSHPDGPFYQVHLPVIPWTDCEEGNEVFSVSSQISKK